MSPFSSVTFWMLQDKISMPSLSMSLLAFCITWSEKESRSVLISLRDRVPIISRILPWRESWRSRVICSGRLFKKFFAASLMPSDKGEMRTLATASTLTLMKSLVGTDCSVLMSTVIWPRYSLSRRSKMGTRMPARPMSTLLSFLRPEMM